MKYTLDLISSHSWYFMELSPSTVALTFNPWPSNIYQLLNWLCTIIPSSISQIHHFNHSSQFQVRYTIPADVVPFSLRLEIKPCCFTMSSVRKSWKQLSLEAMEGTGWATSHESQWRVWQVGSRLSGCGLPLGGALVSSEPLRGCFGTNLIFSSQWKGYFGNCFWLLVWNQLRWGRVWDGYF